jgi:cytosine/adenosine deaminase-related metal-dependent hydrolase
MIIKSKIFDNHQDSWIEINNGKIISINNKPEFQRVNNTLKLEIENSFAFPGLINSHDHLEFSLFPKLGNKKYQDYVEWGDDIHKNNIEVINRILRIPIKLRVEYGIYKNALNGVTTVVHHGEKFSIPSSLIDIYDNYNYLHSIGLHKNWKLKLNLPFNSLPFVIHIGEGVNNETYLEADELIKWNLFNRTLIGIHGITVNEKQAGNFKALVWCPVSNYFLYGMTAQIDKLKNVTTILFGTDSNVSSDWNIWENIRFARKLELLNDIELYNSLTSNAVQIWNLHDKGLLLPGFKADLVITRKKEGKDIFDSLYKTNPEDILLILKDGIIIQFDQSLKKQLEVKINISDYTEIEMNGEVKFVKGRLEKLCKEIRSYHPDIKFPFNYY